MLQEYLTRHGFDWLYAIAPAQVASEIGELYGSQYLNPPSAPILLIDRHGAVHPLEAGRKSAESLLAEFSIKRAETVEMLADLVHWNWARAGRHEELGRISIRQLVDRRIGYLLPGRVACPQ